MEHYGRNTASVVPFRVAVPSSAWVTLNPLSLSPPTLSPFSVPSYFVRAIYNTFTYYAILRYAQKRISIVEFVFHTFIRSSRLSLNLIKSQSCGRIEIRPVSNHPRKAIS